MHIPWNTCDSLNSEIPQRNFVTQFFNERQRKTPNSWVDVQWYLVSFCNLTDFSDGIYNAMAILRSAGDNKNRTGSYVPFYKVRIKLEVFITIHNY
jgi:hypothetical protein